jgi:type I restriction enzyme S subunit
VYSGGTPSTANSAFWDGEIPWVTPKDLSGYEARYIGVGERNITEGGLHNSSARLLSEDTVLLTTRAPIGYVALAANPLATNQGFKNLVCKRESAVPSFIYYLLKHNKFLLESHATGATFKELSGSRLKAIVFQLPDLATQERIADILSAYDDLIENNRRRMALLEDAARQLYREVFVRLRFPGYEHTLITNGVPEGWDSVPTTDAVVINPRTSLSDEEEHWFVEMADLPTCSMVIQQARKREGRSGSKFQNGDTLFARITPCLENGKTAFVDFMAEGEVGRGSTEFIVLRSKRLEPEFVYCLARTYDFRENAIKSMIGSSGRQRVQESCFEKFLVWVPPRTLLNLFTESVRPMFDQIKGLHTQNQKLRAARDLLLPRLMNGEIAV